MYRLTVLISLLFISLSSIAQESPRATQPAAAYDEAQILGKCAGYLRFLSQIFEAQHKLHQAKDASNRSNGWYIATMGALLAAGWKGENVVRTADSIYEGAVASWMALAESGDSNLQREIDKEYSLCLSHTNSQELYREFIKQIANQSTTSSTSK
ncbi:MAG: hypothetical protein U1D41_03205 [Nitrosomonas sp.]|uniref:hypothetical protein n=1 Tax=Nitrosomonas sp. TaxID=42353 RepID=UPI0027335F26|nr:hypothetical protein [Nitrosomonas sp.]MDP3281559.1 hypothetical protein [Nitrosomonas sp.]MDP3664703.1 hypothetical protein [Nitrosomonas sp.]MDZ4105164.1 hypothetical protein [Nitrosomonas sp.]